MVLALLTVLAFFFVTSAFLLAIAGAAGFTAHVLLSLASSGDGADLFEYQFSRMITLFGVLIVGLILGGYVVFSLPVLFAVTLIFSILSTIASFLAMLIRL